MFFIFYFTRSEPFLAAGFLTLGTSHTVAFLRALEAGASNPNGQPFDLPKTDPCWQAITNGWEWTTISSEVEDAIPTFCGWVQMALNSSNSIGRAQTELELATTIANFFTHGCTLAQAIDKAKQGGQKFQASLPSVALYVQRYAGGPEFPLIHFLAKFGQLFGSTLALGRDFFHILTNLDFKVAGQLFPFTRMALWAAMITSPHKAQDGFARVFVKADLERLKSPANIDKTKQAEAMLANAWATMETLLTTGARQEAHLHKCYGRLAVRVAFHICSKEKMSQETTKWQDLPSILKAFSDEVAQTASPSQPARGQVSTATQAGTNSKEPQVENVLTASVKDLAVLQNPHLQLQELSLVCIYFF